MGGAGMGYGQTVPDGYPESSLPWQERQRHASGFAAMLKTIRVVLFQPSVAFSQIQVEGSLGSSMLFVVILGTAGAFFAAFWQVLMHLVGFAAPLARGGGEEMAVLVGGMGVYFVLLVLLAPLFILIGSFLGAGLLHVCLWLVGGVTQPFEATYAVVAYMSGSTAVFNLVPICGGLVGWIWGLVVEIIGLARVHNTGVGRAVLAVFLPLIACCGVMGVIFFLAGGLGAIGAH